MRRIDRLARPPYLYTIYQYYFLPFFVGIQTYIPPVLRERYHYHIFIQS